jgi:hypothetical protein
MQPASSAVGARPEWDKLRQELLRRILDHEMRKKRAAEAGGK